jgi:hypothetical protein
VLKVQESQKSDSEQIQDYFEIVLHAVERYPSTSRAVTVLKPEDHASQESLPSDFASKLLDSIDRNKSLVEQLLATLKFSGMDQRHETIPKAYRTTFDWIYQPSSTHDSGFEWADFGQWLQSADSLYWIAGKPGAGKSTLMKYIYNKPETQVLAEMWPTRTNTNRDWNLSLAGFFFWNSGSEMQKSRIGFLRSMIVQLWNDSVDAAEIFPKHWQQVQSSGDGLEAFTKDELTLALTILLSTQGRFFLLFVDGLDEFEGNTEELADMVLNLSLMPNVKICTASRPWAEFQSKFHNKPQLSMEHLTRRDIAAYIDGQFGTSEEYRNMLLFERESAERLREDIADKSSGVFLWVYIVVSSLLRGMRYGDRMSVLFDKLDCLPRELNELFSKILEQVTPEYAREASELFQFVRKFPEDSTIIALYWLQLTFQQVVDVKILPLSKAEANYHARIMERNLMSRCKCLLDAQQPILPTTKVTWLHRTLREYLDQVDVWDGVRARSPDYDAELALALSLLHQAKARTTSRGQSGPDFLESLHRAIRLHMAIRDPLDDTTQERMQIAFLNDVERTGAEVARTDHPYHNHQWLKANRFEYVGDKLTGFTTVFHLAVVLKWTWYVEHRLRADPDLVQQEVCSLSTNGSLVLTAKNGLWDSQFLCLKYGGGIKRVLSSGMTSASTGSTAWPLSLLKVAALLRTDTGSPPWFKILRNIILFLEMGADPHLKLNQGKTQDVIFDTFRIAKAIASNPDEISRIASYQTYLKNVYSKKCALRRLF